MEGPRAPNLSGPRPPQEADIEFGPRIFFEVARAFRCFADYKIVGKLGARLAKID